MFRSDRVFAIVLASVIAGCSSSQGSPAPSTPDTARVPASVAIGTHAVAAATNLRTTSSSTTIADPGFESGGFASWQQCGSVNATIQKSVVHGGSYAELSGSTTSEPNGDAGVCQLVTIPTTATTLTFWVNQSSNDSVKYGYQEADLLDSSFNTLVSFYETDANTSGWVQKSYSVAAYAGQSVYIYFGVHANGTAGYHIAQYVDDVAFGGSGTPAPTATPTAAPTATPTAAPTVSPTAGATATPTAKPTATPTAAPTASAFPCNDTQFTNDQTAFANGSITADQFEQVCGAVTQVLPAKKTSSGNHGYFYVALPSGYQIEIVSNLDAMAQSATLKPPSTWPWVAVNQYVYVQGRYYYDSASSQGIDWTENDTSSSWQHVGYVAVCTTTGTNCNKYW